MRLESELVCVRDFEALTLQKYDLLSSQKQSIQSIFNLFGSQNSPLKHGTFVIVDGQSKEKREREKERETESESKQVSISLEQTLFWLRKPFNRKPLVLEPIFKITL